MYKRPISAGAALAMMAGATAAAIAPAMAHSNLIGWSPDPWTRRQKWARRDRMRKPRCLRGKSRTIGAAARRRKTRNAAKRKAAR